jgi:hypothetical protein
MLVPPRELSLTETVEGKSVQETGAISEEGPLAGIGRMPLWREHYPRLAVTAAPSASKPQDADGRARASNHC